MLDKVKKFIEDNIDLIEQGNWEEVYKKAGYKLKSLTGTFTEVMFKADIHPENYLSELPEHFLSYSKITEFEIPSNITSIGEGAFACCESLTSIEIPDSVTSISKYAFSHCYCLTSLNIPDSVSIIGYSAFRYCTGLVSVVIPAGVRSIGSLTFYHCNNLTGLTIPDSVTHIGDHAFSDCSDVLMVDYQGSKDQWKKIYNKQAFKNTYFTINCKNGKIVKKKR